MFSQTYRRSITRMNLNTLQNFRHAIYDCFQRAADALFNTADALLTEPWAHSFPELSLSPCFERQWPILYEPFADRRIDHQPFRRTVVRSKQLPDARPH